LPKSKLGTALTYAQNQWDKVKASALDPQLDLDTNMIEIKIRPLKLGLKNWLFLGSAESGKNAALFYTLIENSKVHGLDPERYLVEVIEALRDPAAARRANELTPAAVAAAQAKLEEQKTA
jgi:transposase